MSQGLGAEEIEITEDALELRETGAAVENKKGIFASPLTVIFLTVFIDLVGFGIAIPILPFYVEHFGGTAFEVGALTAVYSAMQFIFAPILGQLSDRYGRRPILFFSILGSSVGFLIVGLANALWLVFLGRIIAGITGGNISTAQAYIADITTPENRARGMGLIGAAFGLGFVFGPAIGGILSRFGSSVPFYAVAALALFNAIMLYFVLPETIKPGRTLRKMRGRFSILRESFQNQNLAIVNVLYFLVITSFSIMTTAFVLYTQFRFGYNEQENGYLFAFIGALSAGLQGGAVGALTKRFGEKRLVVAGCLVMMAALFAVPFVAPGFGGLVGLLVGLACFAIGNSISNPALTTLGSLYSPPDEQGAGLGILQSSASLARAVGPAVAGVLLYSAAAPNDIHITDFSLFRTFWTAAAIMLAAFLLSLYFLSKKADSKTVSSY